jgi:dihydroorotate dehydrogenase electron transfer subunit
MHVVDAKIESHTALTGGYRLLAMHCPVVAGEVRPGQFVHFRVPEAPDLCLRRPFSVYRAEDERVSVLYKEVGAGTRAMGAISEGDTVSVIGPLGNGFPQCSPGAVPVLVAGGYGVAPLSLFARKSEGTGFVFIGGRTGADILCTEDFEQIDWPVLVSTEDGSLGEEGMVTEVLDKWLDEVGTDMKVEFFACGPEGMLKAVCERSLDRGCLAWISMDRHMGCGVGVCLACVQKTISDDGVEEWARTCKDGPVFEGSRIVW